MRYPPGGGGGGGGGGHGRINQSHTQRKTAKKKAPWWEGREDGPGLRKEGLACGNVSNVLFIYFLPPTCNRNNDNLLLPISEPYVGALVPFCPPFSPF